MQFSKPSIPRNTSVMENVHHTVNDQCPPPSIAVVGLRVWNLMGVRCISLSSRKDHLPSQTSKVVFTVYTYPYLS